jgi:hypothetical protein
MMKVQLTEDEWARLLNAAALAPYAQIAPVIAKVLSQLQTIKQVTVPATNGHMPAEENPHG